MRERYRGYGYVRDDSSSFELFRNTTYHQIGVLVPPIGLEVSGGRILEDLARVVREGVTKVIVDVSKDPYGTGRSYAIRISKYAPKAGISKVVIIGLGELFDTADISTAHTLEEAVNKLLSDHTT